MKCDKCNRIPCRCPKEQCCNHFAEYGECVPAGIRNVQPSCKDLAVIPSVTVEQTEGMNNLANCFVHVTQNNTTYYIDDKHRVTIIWAGPVEENNYNIALNPRKLRSQVLYDYANNIAVYYNSLGEYRTVDLTNPLEN